MMSRESIVIDCDRLLAAEQAYDLYDMGDMHILSCSPWDQVGDLYRRLVHLNTGQVLCFVVVFCPGSDQVFDAYFGR